MNRWQRGFTLIEILVALFIFTLLSMLMLGGLRTVINAQSGSERNSAQLRKMQMVLLMLSRDIEQIVNRPILDATGQEEAAFIGTIHSMQFTHAGFANATGSSLQRTGYKFNHEALQRLTWPVLDQAPESMPHTRTLLTDVTFAEFQYLDSMGSYHNTWPADDLTKEVLPRGVKISMKMAYWGELNQLYLIPSSNGAMHE